MGYAKFAQNIYFAIRKFLANRVFYKRRGALHAPALRTARYVVLIMLTCLTFFTGTVCNAQSGPNSFYRPPSALNGRILIVPAGTTLEGRIESTIGSNKSHQGEHFSMRIASPVLANSSEVIIPAGSEILGEVVEAIPASKVPHEKGQPKATGKLRIQITSLKMPEGATYPMVASLIGEQSSGFNRFGNSKDPDLGGGIAYAGSESNFGAVAPRAQSNRRGRGARVLTKSEMMQDPVYGKNGAENGYGNNLAIRSLVKKNRNLFIYQGSPLSIRLNAPLKIGMSTSEGAASILQSPAHVSGETNIDNSESIPHRFSRLAPPSAPAAVQNDRQSNDLSSPPVAVPNVLPGILPDNPNLVIPPAKPANQPAIPPQNNQQVSPF
jgi:hypothetical protein